MNLSRLRLWRSDRSLFGSACHAGLGFDPHEPLAADAESL
jgi:hypothetical protein